MLNDNSVYGRYKRMEFDFEMTEDEERMMHKRKFHYVYDNEEESEDEESREIDYPSDEEEENEEEDYEEDDYEPIQLTDEDFFHRPSRPSQTLTCSVCLNTEIKTKWDWNTLDHYIFDKISDSMIFMNPCQKHAVCVSCVRQSMRNNLHSLLRDGDGNIPCLGDSNCKHANGQRTTIYFDTLSDVFDASEFLRFQSIRTSMLQTTKLQNAHSFVCPLTDVKLVTTNQIEQQFSRILEQDVVRPQCGLCNVLMEKTAACNALRHCDHEVCWMCGFMSRRISLDHWKSCVRFDHDLKSIGYLCVEDKCYSEQSTCKVSSHQCGIQKLNQLRKETFVKQCWNSLTSEQQQDVKKLSIFEQIKLYL